MQALFAPKVKINNLNKKKEVLTSPPLCGKLVVDPSCLVMEIIMKKRVDAPINICYIVVDPRLFVMVFIGRLKGPC